jgi:hypothetical protein
MRIAISARTADRRKSKKRNKKEPQRHKFALRIINLPAEVQLAAIGNFLRRTTLFLLLHRAFNPQ